MESDKFAAKGKVKEVLLQYHKKIHAEESGGDVLTPGVLLLLLAYFKEETISMFITADVMLCAKDINDDPATLHLVLLGTSVLEAQRWMLTVEGVVVTQGAEFIVGLAVLFAAYYLFNMHYALR